MFLPCLCTGCLWLPNNNNYCSIVGRVGKFSQVPSFLISCAVLFSFHFISTTGDLALAALRIRIHLVPMSSMPSTPTPTVSFKGSSISLDDFPLHSSTIADLNNLLWELTTVPPDAQKLLWKGKKTGASSDTTLQDAGLKPGSKILLLGTTAAELSDFKQAESDASRRQAILQQRAASSSSKVTLIVVVVCTPGDSSFSQVRSTTTRQSAKYGFSGIAPLPHLPKYVGFRLDTNKKNNCPA